MLVTGNVCNIILHVLIFIVVVVMYGRRLGPPGKNVGTFFFFLTFQNSENNLKIVTFKSWFWEKKREFWEKSENSEEKVKILREKNSEIKIRILKKDSVFWAKSRILRKKSEIWRKKNFEDKEFWEKSQNPEIKIRILT